LISPVRESLPSPPLASVGSNYFPLSPLDKPRDTSAMPPPPTGDRQDNGMGMRWAMKGSRTIRCHVRLVLHRRLPGPWVVQLQRPYLCRRVSQRSSCLGRLPKAMEE